MKEYRIRYSKTKNTLVTNQVGNFIYFGIARCNTKADNFKKKFGVDIATNRVAKAKNYFQDMDGFAEEWLTDTIYYGHSGLFGVVNVKNVRNLLRDFEIIDDIGRMKG